MKMESENSDRHVVRLRGLPWSATDDDIMNFLKLQIVGGSDGIKRTVTREGRSSGECYVELQSLDDYNTALAKDHDLMGKRYIEVFTSSVKEMNYVLERGEQQMQQATNPGGPQDVVVRMRGLPYQCTKDEVAQFFSGFEIVPNGIYLPLDSSGRSTGEAFVEFSTPAGAVGALGKHKEKIGHRYIEIFKSNKRELAEQRGDRIGMGRMGRGMRPSPYDRPMRGAGRARMGMMRGRYGGGGGGRYSSGGGYGDFYDDEFEEDDYEDEFYEDGDYGYDSYGNGRAAARGGRGGGYADDYFDDDLYEDDYYDDYEDDTMTSEFVVHMRGLPFRATEDDIKAFFSPLVPTRTHIEYGADGRVTGEADAEFASYQDAQSAMGKNKELMQHRYIELFYRGDNNGAGGGSMRGGGGDRGMRRGRGARGGRMRGGGAGRGPARRDFGAVGTGRGRGRARGAYRY